MRILLDAGHGAGSKHNRGGTCFNEGDNNYYYSLVLKRELEKLNGVVVDLVRTNINQDPSIIARASKGLGYDLFLSLHSNGGPPQVRGTEVFDSVERPNKALAVKLSSVIATVFNHNNRGAKYKEGQKGFNWYGVLRNNKAKSSMIVEHGFHSNNIDCNFFKNNHLAIAQATTEVVRDHYNLGGDNIYYSTTNNNRTAQQLQKDLISLGYSVGSYGANGWFGQDTEAAVKKFQRANKLVADGIAGKDSLNKIKELLSKPSTSKVEQELKIANDKLNSIRNILK